jgi:GH24 family phage-related lysozyme (muramidase)
METKVAPPSVSDLATKFDVVSRKDFIDYNTTMFGKLDKIQEVLSDTLEFAKQQKRARDESAMEAGAAVPVMQPPPTEETISTPKPQTKGKDYGGLMAAIAAMIGFAVGAKARQIMESIRKFGVGTGSTFVDEMNPESSLGQELRNFDKQLTETETVFDDILKLESDNDAEDYVASNEEENIVRPPPPPPQVSDELSGMTPQEQPGAPPPTPASPPTPTAAPNRPAPQSSAPRASGAPVRQSSSLSMTQREPSEPGVVSERLLNNIKEHEKFTPKAFWDYKQWTNGYGTKANSPTEVVTPQEADERLRRDVQERMNFVSRFGKQKGYNWNQNQLESLTSFVFNLGNGALQQVTANGTRTNEQIAEAIPKYVNAGGKVQRGLVKRREIELAQFNAPTMEAIPSQMAAASPQPIQTPVQTVSAPPPPALAPSRPSVATVDASQTNVVNTADNAKTSAPMNVPLNARNPDPALRASTELARVTSLA